MKLFTGTSIVEMLLVLSLIGIIAAGALPYLTSFSVNNHMTSTTEHLISYLREAQNNSLHQKNNTTWGVCIVDEDLRLYSGTCASPISSIEYEIPSAISINGLTDVTFSRLRGEPSIPVNIIVSSRIGDSVITINKVGGISI